MSLKKQVAAITGAARGIGFATARRLAQDGAAVAIIDLLDDAAHAAAEKLRADGVKAEAFVLDVSDHQAVQDGVARIVDRMGSLEIMVNAAAIFPFCSIDDMTPQEWRRVMSINLDGTFFCCQAALGAMRRQRYGRIVNFASGTFDLGSIHLAHYVASKGGIIGLSRVLASEAGADGITCNVVAPGVIQTEGFQQVALAKEIQAGVLAGQPIKRPGEPADVAEAIAYLVSPAASFITGQTIAIGGGVTFNGG